MQYNYEHTDKYKHLTFLTKYSKREMRINSKSFLQDVEWIIYG